MTADETYRHKLAALMALLLDLPHQAVIGSVLPADVHWGHVGDLERAIRMAAELRDLLRGEVK